MTLNDASQFHNKFPNRGAHELRLQGCAALHLQRIQNRFACGQNRIECAAIYKRPQEGEDVHISRTKPLAQAHTRKARQPQLPLTAECTREVNTTGHYAKTRLARAHDYMQQDMQAQRGERQTNTYTTHANHPNLT